MTLKEIIREKALELGFEDVGFTGVDPLDEYIREIDSRPPAFMTDSLTMVFDFATIGRQSG